MHAPAIVDRILAHPLVTEIRNVLDAYGRAPGGLLANGLAFATLFASFPIALLVLGVAGLFVGDPSAQTELAEALKTLFPPLAGFVDQALSVLSTSATAVSILGLIGVIWAVSQLYVTLDVAFSRIFDDGQHRDIVGRTVRGFLWVVLLIGLVAFAIIVGAVSSILTELFPHVPFSIEALRNVIGSWPFLLVAGVVVTGLIYRVLPSHAPAVSSIWLPAVFVGIVIVLLSQLFLRLAPLLVGAAALAGSLATAFIALAWLSFTFQALLYGASWVRVREDRRRSRQ